MTIGIQTAHFVLDGSAAALPVLLVTPFVLLRCASVPGVSGPDCAGIRVHIPGGAEIVSLCAVRIRGDVRLDIGAAIRGVALDAVGARVGPSPIVARVLSLCTGSDERQCCREN